VNVLSLRSVSERVIFHGLKPKVKQLPFIRSQICCKTESLECEADSKVAIIWGAKSKLRALFRSKKLLFRFSLKSQSLFFRSRLPLVLSETVPDEWKAVFLISCKQRKKSFLLWIEERQFRTLSMCAIRSNGLYSFISPSAFTKCLKVMRRPLLRSAFFDEMFLSSVLLWVKWTDTVFS